MLMPMSPLTLGVRLVELAERGILPVCEEVMAGWTLPVAGATADVRARLLFERSAEPSVKRWDHAAGSSVGLRSLANAGVRAKKRTATSGFMMMTRYEGRL